MPGIADLLDSDMEQSNHYINENSLLSSGSEAEVAPKGAPAKKTRKRKCVTMPKSKSRVAKSSPAAASKKSTQKASASRRKAIEYQVETEVLEQNADNDEHHESHRSTSRPLTKAKAGQKPSAKMILPVAEEDDVEESVVFARSSHAQTRSSNPAQRVSKTSSATTRRKVAKGKALEAPVTQMEIDGETDELEELPRQLAERQQAGSRPQQETSFRRRAGSASDTERGDPNLRRRLGDITRKFENIDVKYRNLKEVGINEANANVERMRKQCEATTEASTRLVASLKKELELQAPLAQDARKLRREIQGHETELSKLTASNVELSKLLSTAQNEIKGLQAKLAAARTASEEQPATKAPGSALKNSMSTKGMTASNNESAQMAQMKLDLYGDLTGLIVRNVKKAEDGVTYDCIQTGRNGTLHFKLFIDAEDAKNLSFEETEFLYTPLLDKNRDHDMMELMPQYLAEEITFARQNAAKFYQRVVDTLTRRPEAW